MNTLPIHQPVPESVEPPAAVPAPAPAPPALPQTVPPQINPPPLPSQSSALAAGGFNGILGKVDVLSEPEEARLRLCETAIKTAGQTFVEMGLALGEIRDSRLYRNDYTSFEEYCQRRWEFNRRKADDLIAVARIYRQISATPGLPYPERESQLRPLLPLSRDDAELAWQYAVQYSRGRPVTARMVKGALKNLHMAPSNPRPAPAGTQQSKREIRGLVSSAMDELLSLIVRHADYPSLMEKFEALHGHLQLLFRPAKRKN